MRTLTVKETATLLGVSVRTVQNRLNSGELKGKRIENQYGVSEWRVWPNKEIMERSNGRLQLEDVIEDVTVTSEFQGGDSTAVLEAEDASKAQFSNESQIATIIREMTAEFAKQLTVQKSNEYQLMRQLEEKDRQIKALPDFQKQAEDKALETIALQQQIDAIKNEGMLALLKEQEKSQALEVVLSNLEQEKQALSAKMEEALTTAEKLADLEKVVLELQKPKPGFWQKLFGSQS